GYAVSLGLDLVLVILVLRCIRHVDAITRCVELPAMIDAADAPFLIAPEEQGGAAMRAAVVHDPDSAYAVAEPDQPLAQQQQPEGGAVALQFRRHRCRDPVLPHHLAHDRARADADQVFAICIFAHAELASIARSRCRPDPGPGAVAQSSPNRVGDAA